MPPTPDHAADLQRQVDVLEAELTALAGALRGQDACGVEAHAARLHRGLAGALRCATSLDAAAIDPATRRRLAAAGAQLVRQREALARSTATLDRAVDLLLPDATTGARLYDRRGRAAGGRAIRA